MTASAWAWIWLAVPWYVDGDAACPGDGSDAAPFCTIQEAFDNPALAAGDEILVRDAAVAYGEAQVIDIDGTDAAPIVLRPDDAHTPIVGGSISLFGSSHWTVRGLTFDGQLADDHTVAIIADTTTDVVEGIVIEDNTILDWGGALVTVVEDGVGAGIITVTSYPPSGGPTMVDPVVRNNRIIGGLGKGIRISSASGAAIEGNEIADLACQMETNGPGMSGIYVLGVGGAEITRNRIRDFDATDCSLDGDLRVIGVWVQSSANAEVHHNLVERMGGMTDVGMGIDLIHSSNDGSIHHNIIVAADQCGLCNGTMGSSGAARARFVNNTVIGGLGSGLELLDGEDSEFLNNIVVGAGRSQARILVQGVSTWTFENNLYLPLRGRDNIGRFDYAAAVDLATWQEGCGCDAATLVEDPLLPPAGTEDFTPATGSPALDRGLAAPEVDRYNGRAPDLGAVEAPIVLQASIAPGEPDTIRLDVQSETSPLRHDPACAGLSVAIAGLPVVPTTCELDGDDRVLVRLSEVAHAGDAVTLSYEGWSLGNRDAIGGVVHGWMVPFAIAVDNGSQEPPSADGGEGTTGAGSDGSDGTVGSGTATGTDGGSLDDGLEGGSTGPGAGDYPGLGGCGCHQRPSGGPAFSAWLLLALAWRRRTIA